MGGLAWRPLQGVDRSRLREARLQAHYAVQWLARAARAYVAPKADDSHTNLGWDDALGGFTTHSLPDGSRLGLRIADLALALMPSDGVRLALNGQTEADIRAWLGPHMNAKGLDAHSLDAPSPYEIPQFAIGSGGRYAVDGQTLGELAGWYANANSVLDKGRQDLIGRNLHAPPVRCWPHHFDLDTLIYFDTKDPDDVRTMGVGLSPGDEYYDEPYFYASLYPAPDAASLPPQPAVGHWHTHDFTAAIVTASRLLAVQDQAAEAAMFLKSATDFAIKQLS